MHSNRLLVTITAVTALVVVIAVKPAAKGDGHSDPNSPPNVRHFIPDFSIKPELLPFRRIPRPLRHAEVARLPASITSDVVQAACTQEAADFGAVCGYVNVPFDRKHPKQGTIPIYFELYLHHGSGHAESAILASFGGPGVTTSGMRSSAFDLFGQDLDVHDMLLIDDRGRGLSGTLGVTNCPEVQQGTAPWDQALADCAAELGNAAGRYGTGDIAQDTEAVRAALGYDKVDYFGWSYGGTDVTAYATRFGEHLRSVVLDSPSGTPNLDKFVFEQTRTQADPRMVDLVCSRSPTCSTDHHNRLAELDGLIQTVRFQPVEGDAYDANGNLTHARIDEEALLNVVIANVTGNFTSTGEVLAAAESLWHGDSRPLLRLGVEGSPAPFPRSGDWGDPTFYSVAAQYATSCVDHHEAWKWSATVPKREKQYAEAVADLPADYFAPFSKAAATGQSFSWFGRDCLFWQQPTPSSPVVPPHATYPSTPTLVLSGDLDHTVPLEETRQVAALFPNSTFVPVAEAGHGSVFWSQCAASLASEFIETLRVGDSSCTRTPEVVWPAVGRFPLFVREARPADVDPRGTNQIAVNERKVVTVAVATAIDALQRSMLGDGIGVGLRAGAFQTNKDSSWTTTLTGCAFAIDVTVNGTFTWASDQDQSFVADLVVAGPGTAGGTIHVAGFWEAPGPVGNFRVTGKLGGKKVAVLVPEA
jgi:pimeloyl-ACP methyl ester carboxylesterase